MFYEIPYETVHVLLNEKLSGDEQLEMLLPLLDERPDLDLLEISVDNRVLYYLDKSLRPKLSIAGNEHKLLRLRLCGDNYSSHGANSR
jgi:hypothetical protein